MLTRVFGRMSIGTLKAQMRVPKLIEVIVRPLTGFKTC